MNPRHNESVFMKKFIVMMVTVCFAISVANACDHACECKCHKQKKDEKVKLHFQVTGPGSSTSSGQTSTWQQQTVVTQVVVQQIVQPVVIEQSVQAIPVVTVPVLEPVGYYRGAYYNGSFVSAGASISINSYGWNYPSTYWQENSRWQENRNIRNTQRNYGIVGHNSSRGGYGGYGSGITGERHNSGIRSFQPVRQIPTPPRR
jgi:hypothetical protein